MGGSVAALATLLESMDAPDILPPELLKDEVSPSGGSTPVTPNGPGTSSRAAPSRVMSSASSVMARSTAVATMPFGDALTTLRRYMPNFTVDAEHISSMESNVDGAVLELRSKGLHQEAALLQNAMLVVSRRFRMPSKSPEFYRSVPPSQPPSSQATNGSDDRIREYINAADASGFTPPALRDSPWERPDVQNTRGSRGRSVR